MECMIGILECIRNFGEKSGEKGMQTTFRAVYIALQIAPLIAMMMILPYTLFYYVRTKRINVRYSTYIYIFALYFLCAYFMTMFPLPDPEDFAHMRPISELIQLVPFQSFMDIRAESIVRDLAIIIFNVILTVPLGFFARFLFGFDFKKTLLAGFLTSLFYEVTQLTGIFFIYPRPYRIFDVDDLIINTLGAVIGYFAVPLVSRMLPEPRDAGCQLAQGSEVSFFQRAIATLIDICIVFSILLLLILPIPPLRSFFADSGRLLRFPVFYIAFMAVGAGYSALLVGGTVGTRLTGLVLMARGGRKASRGKCSARFCLINAAVVAIPFWVYFFMTLNAEYAGIESIVWVLLGALLMMCAAAVLLEMMFNAVTHGSSMFYDRILGSHLVYGNSKKSSMFGIRVIDIKPLCDTDIDGISEQISSTLLSMGLPRESVVKVRLMAEGIMLDWKDRGLEGLPCELRLDKRFWRKTLMLSVSGEDKTTVAATEGYAEMLEGLELELETYYTGEKNICNITIP